jgi:hypothetical protein
LAPVFAMLPKDLIFPLSWLTKDLRIRILQRPLLWRSGRGQEGVEAEVKISQGQPALRHRRVGGHVDGVGRWESQTINQSYGWSSSEKRAARKSAVNGEVSQCYDGVYPRRLHN